MTGPTLIELFKKTLSKRVDYEIKIDGKDITNFDIDDVNKIINLTSENFDVEALENLFEEEKVKEEKVKEEKSNKNKTKNSNNGKKKSSDSQEGEE